MTEKKSQNKNSTKKKSTASGKRTKELEAYVPKLREKTAAPAAEQKDEPVFDEKKAEARAMELTGSKAFRQYMKLHPGSLLAAAQKVKAFVTVEMNIGQMIEDVELATRCLKPVLSCTRCGGVIPSPDDVMGAIRKACDLGGDAK